VSHLEKEAAALAARAPGAASAVHLDVSSSSAHEQLSACVADSDVVISLLPAAFHPMVADHCIKNKVFIGSVWFV
jgi:saccharopine dehydrogenase-like NADP-dependent oxidoreductase